MIKLACIGLDTSHAVKFTELFQGKDQLITSLRVTKCLRFPSAFQAEDGQDQRQAAMTAMGVTMASSFAEAVRGVDGIMLEINDPALHLEYFRAASEIGVPIFVDKPLADTVANARKIHQLTLDRNLSVWSSSTLRFAPEVKACHAAIPHPLVGSVYGYLGLAPAGSSVVWYGVHTFEMLTTLMGLGAQAVFARNDAAQGVVAMVRYADGRNGLVACNPQGFSYGGSAQAKDDAQSFLVDAKSGGPYASLIVALVDFFLKGTIPVPMTETFEIQAMLNAAEASLASGREEPVATLAGS